MRKKGRLFPNKFATHEDDKIRKRYKSSKSNLCSMSKSCTNNDQVAKTIAFLKEQVVKLEKMSVENFYWYLLRKWVLIIVAMAIGGVLGLIIQLPAISIPIINSTLDFQETAKTLFAPIVTINGLFITFLPVLSFFLINQIKDQKKDTEKELEQLFCSEELPEKCKNCEGKAIMKQSSKAVNVFYHNYISAVLRYTETFVLVAIFSLILLPIVYFFLSSRYFLLVELLVVDVLAAGIFPIVSTALHKEPIKISKSP